MNITDTIDPKVDQLTADHLIGRTMVIRITAVRLAPGDQPCEIHYDGQNGLPYRPGKSMRRVLVHVWGGDANAYVGRRLRLYRDDDVQFGGLKVGGIRISHMSHINGAVTMALTAKKGSKKAFKVQPLEDEPAKAAETKVPVRGTTAEQAAKQEWTDADEQRPILNSALELKQVDATVFPQRVRQALAGIHDVDTLASWESGMKRIVADGDDWEHIENLIQGRRTKLAEAAAA